MKGPSTAAQSIQGYIRSGQALGGYESFSPVVLRAFLDLSLLVLIQSDFKHEPCTAQVKASIPFLFCV